MATKKKYKISVLGQFLTLITNLQSDFLVDAEKRGRCNSWHMAFFWKHAWMPHTPKNFSPRSARREISVLPIPDLQIFAHFPISKKSTLIKTPKMMFSYFQGGGGTPPHFLICQVHTWFANICPLPDFKKIDSRKNAKNDVFLFSRGGIPPPFPDVSGTYLIRPFHYAPL